MFPIQDRVSRAAQAQIESQLDAGTALADKAIHNFQQMTDLNLNLARAALEQTNFAARQFMTAQDTEQFLSLAAAQFQPNAERTLDYGYYLTTLTAKAQAELIEVIGDRITDTSGRLSMLAADVDREAPSGLIAAMRLLGALIDGGSASHGEPHRGAQTTASALDREPDAGAGSVDGAAGVRRRFSHK